MKTLATFGEELKKEIRAQGLTQREVARMIGISDNAMSQICVGSAFPKKSTLLKICEVLKIEIIISIIKK